MVSLIPMCYLITSQAKDEIYFYHKALDLSPTKAGALDIHFYILRSR
jgi:hypothetical protein